MTYRPSDSLIGPGTVSGEAITAWFNQRGQQMASQFAPDGKFKPVDPGLGNAIVTECSRYPEHLLNWDLVAAQISHETASGQSRYFRERNNVGGIGAINSDPDQALWFDTLEAGVRAHVAHLLNYVAGTGPWSSDDPRGLPEAFYGVVGELRDLEQRWAWSPPDRYAATPPDKRYGGMVATLANALVDFANNGSWEPPMAGDDSRFRWMPDVTEFGYPKGTRGRAGYRIDLGIIHYTEGTDSSGWLRGNNGSSTHYLTDQQMRPFEQHVREADAAWTAGNREYNLRGINVEGELPGNFWTPTLIRELARTTLPIWKRHDIPLVYLGRDNGPGKRGLIGHADVPNQDHTDPGSTFDWTLYISELRRLDGQQPPPADELPPTQPDPWGTTYWIANAFVADIRKHDWMLTGYAVSEGFLEDGLYVQYFERARLELHPGNVVMRGLVGREALWARYPERKP